MWATLLQLAGDVVKASATISFAATLYIEGSPNNKNWPTSELGDINPNTTITNAYSLWINDGNTNILELVKEAASKLYSENIRQFVELLIEDVNDEVIQGSKMYPRNEEGG